MQHVKGHMSGHASYVVKITTIKCSNRLKICLNVNYALMSTFARVQRALMISAIDFQTPLKKNVYPFVFVK